MSVSPCVIYTLSYSPPRIVGYTDGKPQIERRPGPYQRWLIQDFGAADPIDWSSHATANRVAITTTARDMPGLILATARSEIVLDDLNTEAGRNRDPRLQNWVMYRAPTGNAVTLLSLFNRDWVLKTTIDGKLVLDSLSRPQSPVDPHGMCYRFRLVRDTSTP